jgi:hypothetical protein
VLLDNHTIADWCRAEEDRRGKLGILDALAEHFDADISEAMDRGTMLSA